MFNHNTIMHYFYIMLTVFVVFDEANAINNNTEVFAIMTEGCAIPGYPHVTKTIHDIVERPENGPNCSLTVPLVVRNSTHLWLDENILSYYNIWNKGNFYCCYTNFSAVYNIKNISYGICKEFSNVLKAEHPYARVECYADDMKVYEDYFIFDVNENVKTIPAHEAKYNVLILGFESISRINFHRTMPLTSKFLKDKGIIELFGYNKIGDNSFPNLFPLLTGKSFNYVKKECINIKSEVFDTEKCEFIWSKYKKQNYITALLSDSSAAVLGYYEYCFPQFPTDIYIQPFIFETRNTFKNKYYEYHQCMGSKYYFKMLIDYIYNLTNKLSSTNMMTLFWEESVTHEQLNRPRVMDKTYFDFLSSLDDDGYLNKTIVFVLSDHGMRWGEISLTDQGRMEERLPFLGVLFPERFRRRYKLAFKNAQANSNRLITPFDIYETLLHILDEKSLSDEFIASKRSDTSAYSATSLFYLISRRRTCESIGIEEHWCACHRGKKLKPRPRLKSLVTQILIMHMNNLISRLPACSKLTLNKILHVTLTENYKLELVYNVIVRTSPGDGIFDGTLVRRNGAWEVSGTVSRLNTYRNQSACIKNDSIKMYCFCG